MTIPAYNVIFFGFWWGFGAVMGGAACGCMLYAAKWIAARIQK